jgi:hypothetical protein
MHQVRCYKKGWVAEAPKAAFAVGEHVGASEQVPPRLTERLQEHSRFILQEDGKWSVVLPASEGTRTFADITLDIGQDCLRVTFPDCSPELLGWPPGIGSTQMDACSARFSKRRGELTITVPASQNEDGSPDSYTGQCRSSQPEMTSSTPTPAPQAIPAETSMAPKAPALHQNLSQEGSGYASDAPVLTGGSLCDALKQAAERVRTAGKEETDEMPKGPDPMALQMAGTWMLHSAAATGDVKRLGALLSAGIDANGPDDSGVSALEKACIAGHVDVVTALLDRGATPNGISCSSSTPLHRAVAGGAQGRRLVQMLCERGANHTAKDGAGRTPADLARELGFEPLPGLN